jgi:hypothetical protein
MKPRLRIYQPATLRRPAPRIRWSMPHSRTRWAKWWGVGRHTLSKILASGQVRCKCLSRELVMLALDDLPEEVCGHLERLSTTRSKSASLGARQEIDPPQQRKVSA